MTRGVKAWLITWDSWADDPPDPVVAIFDPRLSHERIAWFMEHVYAREFYTESERLEWMLQPRKNPYKARFGGIGNVPYTGQIFVGHEPYLYGRLVRNLRAIPDGLTERFIWDEYPPLTRSQLTPLTTT
jgi:hypothetical protein